MNEIGRKLAHTVAELASARQHQENWPTIIMERAVRGMAKRATITLRLLGACARHFGGIARRSSAMEPITPERARMLMRDGATYTTAA